MINRPESTLADWLRVLLRRWPVVAGVVAVVVGLVLVRDLRSERLYESRAEIFLTSQIERSSGGFTRPYVDPDRLLQSELQLVKSDVVATSAEKSTNRPLPSVRALAIGRSNLFVISTQDVSPKAAKEATAAYLASYIEIRNDQQQRGIVAAIAELERSLAELDSPTENASNDDARRAELRDQLTDLRIDLSISQGLLQTVSAPSLPNSPVSPRPVRNALLAILPALVLGALAALFVASLDETIGSDEDVASEFPQLPLIGQVPRIRRGEPALTVSRDPKSPATEAYRRARADLESGESFKALMVTSAVRGEGKTTTASNLAYAIAESGKRVLLIDGDLRAPRLSQLLSGSQSGDGEHQWEELAENLHFVRVPTVSDPSDIARGDWVVGVLGRARGSYDLVVVDAPPVLVASETTLFANCVDGILLVVGAGVVSERQLRKVLRATRNLRPIIGVIVNGVNRFEVPGYSKY